MHEVGTSRPENKIGEMLVSSRSLAEYRAMFVLTADDLRRPILDCPGGAASFTAEVNGAGGQVIACDPIYDRPAAAIGDLSRYDMRRANQYQLRNPGDYVWTFFDGPEQYLESRTRSGELFTEDMTANPDHYLTAALPTLPFPERAFDLVLSSHFLFAYADRLGREFHLDCIRELVRVAAEVRVFPLMPFGFATNPELPSMIEELNRTGLLATVVTVGYELQRGANQMLRVVRRDG